MDTLAPLQGMLAPPDPSCFVGPPHFCQPPFSVFIYNYAKATCERSKIMYAPYPIVAVVDVYAKAFNVYAYAHTKGYERLKAKMCKRNKIMYAAYPIVAVVDDDDEGGEPHDADQAQAEEHHLSQNGPAVRLELHPLLALQG